MEGTCRIHRYSHELAGDKCNGVSAARVTPAVTPVTNSVTPRLAKPIAVTGSVTPGQPCPTCGHTAPLTPAQKQARYRQKKAGTS